MDKGISEAGRRIIDTVIDAPVAWRSPGELAGRLGWELERTLDEIADLDARGWLEAWDLVDGPVVTLSVAATARCGVRLVEVGRESTPRWARPGDPEPPGLPATGVFRTHPGAALDLVADANPGVEALAILAEEVEAALPAGQAVAGWDGLARLPRPTVLIGGGMSPWPGPGQDSGDACPACRSARLGSREYCLRCDRWGLDAALVEAGAAQDRTRRPAPKLSSSQAETGRRDAERRKRRNKRRSRRSAQARQPRLGRPGGKVGWSGPVAI